VYFLRRLRASARFESAEALRLQIARDARNARRHLGLLAPG